MKRLLTYLVVSIALALSSALVAADALIQFKPGTPIKSAEVNANFKALSDSKQNRVTGECKVGSAIRVVKADGSVECEPDDGGPGGASYSAGDGLKLNGSTFSVSFAGSGSATTVARSDHDHLGETWTGKDNPLVLEGSFADSGTDTSGAPLVLGNSSGAGLRIAETAGDGVQVGSAGRDGVYVDSAGRDGVHVDSAPNGDGVDVGSVRYVGFGVQSANYGVEVISANDYGVSVGSAGYDGVSVYSADYYGGQFNGDKAGVYARGATNATPDLILGGTFGSDDDGRIASDPDLPGSDIFLTSNDAVVLELDADGNNDGHFFIKNDAGTIVFEVAEDGTVKVNGDVAHSSDRNLKENLEPVNPQAVLEKVAEMPVSRWNFIQDETKAPHLGPMAQDFHAAFGLGADDTHIGMIDADGVALAAIQGLYELLQERDARIADLEARVERLEAQH